MQREVLSLKAEKLRLDVDTGKLLRRKLELDVQEKERQVLWSVSHGNGSVHLFTCIRCIHVRTHVLGLGIRRRTGTCNHCMLVTSLFLSTRDGLPPHGTFLTLSQSEVLRYHREGQERIADTLANVPTFCSTPDLSTTRPILQVSRATPQPRRRTGASETSTVILESQSSRDVSKRGNGMRPPPPPATQAASAGAVTGQDDQARDGADDGRGVSNGASSTRIIGGRPVPQGVETRHASVAHITPLFNALRTVEDVRRLFNDETVLKFLDAAITQQKLVAYRAMKPLLPCFDYCEVADMEGCLRPFQWLVFQAGLPNPAETIAWMGRILQDDQNYDTRGAQGARQCKNAATCVFNWYLGCHDFPLDFVHIFHSFHRDLEDAEFQESGGTFLGESHADASYSPSF